MKAPLSVLPLADRYARFRDAVFSSIQEARRLAGTDMPLTELDLQSLWFAGAFGTEFTTVDGKPVRIVDFGIWNSGAGPDFTGCTITINGQPHRGDIELDPDARDWERHGHGANPDYANVVLHVILHQPDRERFYTRTSDHREVAQIQINTAMLATDAKPDRRLASAHIGRCSRPLSEMDGSHIASLLESAAQYRLELKSQRLHHSVAVHGREQAIFQALAQTLGYRNNQQPFFILAQRLTLKRLLKTKPLQRDALLFGASGFLENIQYEHTTPETRHYLRQLWSEWWKLRASCERWLKPQQALRWKFVATRPGNHPQRRLGALSAMLRKWPEVSAPLMDATRWTQLGWRHTLLSLGHEYWSNHYTLMAHASVKPLALVGETRVQEILANVAYPLLVPERTRLWAEYLELPALMDNQKVRRAVLRLFGRDERAAEFQKKLHQQQGLLQIYEDFCLEDDSACADCPFPEKLKEWS